MKAEKSYESFGFIISATQLTCTYQNVVGPIFIPIPPAAATTNTTATDGLSIRTSTRTIDIDTCEGSNNDASNKYVISSLSDFCPRMLCFSSSVGARSQYHISGTNSRRTNAILPVIIV